MPIFDQGYQHWNGQFSSQAWRWMVITRHGVRTQLKNRMVRILLLLDFARPLRRFDYFLGKLGVIGALVAAVAVVPAVFAYVMGVCFSLDFTVIRDTYRLLLASVVYGLVIAVSVGTLMLALSSLT